MQVTDVEAGGGVALLYATRVLEGKKGGNHDQQVGIDIVRKALQAPARQIAENAGTDGSIVRSEEPRLNSSHMSESRMPSSA